MFMTNALYKLSQPKLAIKYLALMTALLSFWSCSDHEKVAQELYIQSTQDIKHGLSDSAEYKLEKAITLHPGFTEARLSLGELKYYAGKFDEAIPIFNEIIESDSTNYTAVYLLANCYAKKGVFSKALELYPRAIKLRPDSVMAYNNYAAALTSLNQYDEALSEYQTVVTMLLKSSDPQAKHMLATAYFDAATALGRKGDYKKAVEAYQTAILLQPNFADAYYYLGITYYNMNDLQSTISAFRNAVKARPDFVKAYNDLGIVCGKTGDSASCLNYLGMSLVLQGKFADGITMYRRAIAHKHNFAEAQFNLGLAQSYSGDLVGAEKTFVQITEEKSDYLDAYLQLQTIYNQLGNKEKSEEMQRKALKLGAKAAKK